MTFLKVMRKLDAASSVTIESAVRENDIKGFKDDGQLIEVTVVLKKKDEDLDDEATQEEINLYVSTDLDTWEIDNPHQVGREISFNEARYRRLDPEYYAWLKHRVERAITAVDEKLISLREFDTITTRFDAIHIWAEEIFGKERLDAAIQQHDHKSYDPPRQPAYLTRPGPQHPEAELTDKPESTQELAPEAVQQFLFPEECSWKFFHQVPDSAKAKVDAIRDQALALGWGESRLYCNRGRLKFPYGDDYGLICFVADDQRIGEVTSEAIEMIGPPPRESKMRFKNPDMKQSWNKLPAVTTTTVS